MKIDAARHEGIAGAMSHEILRLLDPKALSRASKRERVPSPARRVREFHMALPGVPSPPIAAQWALPSPASKRGRGEKAPLPRGNRDNPLKHWPQIMALDNACISGT